MNSDLDKSEEEVEKEQAIEIKAQKQEEAYDSICLREAMSTPNGRHFIWGILSDCGIYQDGFHPDPCIHARNSGARRVGLKLMTRILDDCPGLHEQMFAEHKYKEEE